MLLFSQSSYVDKCFKRRDFNVMKQSTYLIKLSTLSGRASVLLTHVPGRGVGTLARSTGNHAELDDACITNNWLLINRFSKSMKASSIPLYHVINVCAYFYYASTPMLIIFLIYAFFLYALCACTTLIIILFLY